MSNTSKAAQYAAEIEVTQALIKEKINQYYGIECGVTDVEYVSGYDGKPPHFAVLEVFHDPERLEAWRDYFLANEDEWKPWINLKATDLFGEAQNDDEGEPSELIATREAFASGVVESITDTALEIASDYDSRLTDLHYSLICEEAREAVAERIGKAVREARIAQGLTIAELGRRAGLARQHLPRIEAAQLNVTIDTLAALGAALGTRFEI